MYFLAEERTQIELDETVTYLIEGFKRVLCAKLERITEDDLRAIDLVRGALAQAIGALKSPADASGSTDTKS